MPHEHAVLMSGGIDSSTVAALLVHEGRSAEAVFVDYGQPAALDECVASQAVARHYGLPWTSITFGGLDPGGPGEIRGRNDLLIAGCLAASTARTICIGTHSGAPYTDCSVSHTEAWQKLLDVEYFGTRRLLAPLVDMTRVEVLSLAKDLALPFDLTRSCELPGLPCESCPSCRDREAGIC